MSQALDLIKQYDSIPRTDDFEGWVMREAETNKILEAIDDLVTTEFRFPDITPYRGIATMIDEALRLLDYYANYYKVAWHITCIENKYQCEIEFRTETYHFLEIARFTHGNLCLTIIGAIAKHQEKVNE